MELFFREIGEGHPLIILHGLFGSSDNWLTLGKKFAESHKVYLVDLRNHGNSFHDESFNYRVMAEDVVRLMEKQDISEALILGHSMGGKVAMTIALNHPQKVNKLIIADVSPAAYPLRHDEIVEALTAIDLENITSRQDADSQLAKYIKEAGIRQFLLKNLMRYKDGSYGWKLNLPVIEREIDNVGAAMNPELKFNKPTLFIKGGLSKYILDKDLPLIQNIFPNHHLMTISDAGHWVHAEKPEEVYDLVKDFIVDAP